MAKPTMGRGLGALMSETKPQGDNQNSTGKPEIAAGVRTLMAGHSAVRTATPASVSAEPSSEAKLSAKLKPSAPVITDPKGPAIPRWYFLVADVLLIGLALFVALKSPTPMPTSRMILAIAIVVLAGGFGLCALLAGTDKE